MPLSTIAKCILLPVNSFFMVVGLGIAVVGIILTSFPDLLLDQIYDLVKENLDQYLHKGDIKLPDNTDGLKDLPFLEELGKTLLVLGLILFAVCSIGWVGAACTTCCRWLLIVFTAMLVVVIVAEVGTGSMFLVTDSKLHDDLRSELKDKIIDQFNETSGNAFSSIIILISDIFDCCGIDSPADFGNKSHHFCSVNETGCYTKLTDLINDNTTWEGIIFAVLLLLQALEVVFAVVIFKGANKISPF